MDYFHRGFQISHNHILYIQGDDIIQMLIPCKCMWSRDMTRLFNSNNKTYLKNRGYVIKVVAKRVYLELIYHSLA